MLKAILSVFGGTFGMILKVLLVLGLIGIMGYCLITMMMEPFLWGGVIRLGAIAVAVLIFRWLIRPREDD